mmetsp:Transcript_1304/g.2869  ORF Transcript_1304/g.2869 Transcript_1304/m.2869 type:complete len:203 (+) Transcript_1304:337-945(+)
MRTQTYGLNLPLSLFLSSICFLGRPAQKPQPVGRFEDSQATNTLGPIFFTPCCSSLGISQTHELGTNILWNKSTVTTQMVLCHILSSLIQAIHCCRVVNCPPSTRPARKTGAVPASQSHLCLDNWLVSSLGIPLDVVGRCLEEFNLLPKQALVLGQTLLVTLHVHHHRQLHFPLGPEGRKVVHRRGRLHVVAVRFWRRRVRR